MNNHILGYGSARVGSWSERLLASSVAPVEIAALYVTAVFKGGEIVAGPVAPKLVVDEIIPSEGGGWS